jgi:hypothetical protein
VEGYSKKVVLDVDGLEDVYRWVGAGRQICSIDHLEASFAQSVLPIPEAGSSGTDRPRVLEADTIGTKKNLPSEDHLTGEKPVTTFTHALRSLDPHDDDNA